MASDEWIAACETDRGEIDIFKFYAWYVPELSWKMFK